MPTEPENNSLESKLNKKVISENISIESLSHLKVFNGQKLLGSFEIDAEGVVPPSELVLVKDGILKTLLNSRTPSFGVENSNGHNRMSSFGGSSVGPGVVKVSVKESMAKDKMKQKLIHMAKENGNEYCFIIRALPHVNDNRVYRVDVNTGKETLVNTGRVGGLDMNDLKEDMYFSEVLAAYNVLQGEGFVSVICPDAMIVKEIDIVSDQPSQKKKETIAKSPLL